MKLQPAASAEEAVEAQKSRRAATAATRAAVGEGRVALDRRRRRQMARLARYRAARAGRHRRPQIIRSTGGARRLHRRRAARHGRIEPRRRSAEPSLRHSARLAQAARSGFHRSRTDPRRSRAPIDLANTLFIVSRKSGTTLEPNILMDYFFAQERSRRGEPFIAITDPGSALEKTAKADRLRAHLLRRSGDRRPLFGAVEFRPGPRRRDGPRCRAPSAPTRRRCVDALRTRLCRRTPIPACSSACARALLATNASATRSPSSRRRRIASVRALAGAAHCRSPPASRARASMPVDDEPLGDPPSIRQRPRFRSHRAIWRGADDAGEPLDALEKAGHPVVRIDIGESYQLGQVFFLLRNGDRHRRRGHRHRSVRSAGRRSRKSRRRASSPMPSKRTAALHDERPCLEPNGIALYADARQRRRAAGRQHACTGLRAHFERVGAATTSRSSPSSSTTTTTRRHAAGHARSAVATPRRVATCLEFGPRYPAFDRAGLQGRPEQRRVPEITCDACGGSRRSPGARRPSAWSRRRRRGAISGAERARAPRLAHSSEGSDERPRPPCADAVDRGACNRRSPCRLGMIGLGRMGGNIARRLMKRRPRGRGLRPRRRSCRRAGEGARDGAARSLDDLVRQLKAPRAVWVMLPAGEADRDDRSTELAGALQNGDIIIDGGNTFYQRRHPPRQGAARQRASTMSMSAPPAACGGWSAATA